MCQIKSPTEFDSLLELITYFKDEATCLKFVEQSMSDENGVYRCPHCGSDKVYRFKDGVKFKCGSCKEHFSAKVGTIFEGSKLPMRKWMIAIYLISSHKKGISSYQLARDLKITQKSAWFMLHRIRVSLQPEYKSKMTGVIMSDESFIGGRNKNRHIHKKVKNSGGRNFIDKIPVIGLIQEGGEIRCVAIPDTSNRSIQPVVNKHVERGSILVTDEYVAYKGLGKKYNHQVVQHRLMQYKSQDGYSTNAVEGFWTHMKKSLYGIYHKVSRKHLQKYLYEIQFRWNTRHLGEGQRLKLVMSGVDCRLKYKHLIQKT